MKTLRFSLFNLCLSLFASSAIADPNIKLLEGTEWKAACHKMIDGIGSQKATAKKLRTTYTLQGEELIWKVQTFNDEKCEVLKEENRYVSKCKWKVSDEFAECEQKTDDMASPLTLKVKAHELKNKNLQITTIAESEEPSVEVLMK
ncbi:MAG: hypothetical protein AB7F59_07845 [Bdellovibrionales bacterium]